MQALDRSPDLQLGDVCADLAIACLKRYEPTFEKNGHLPLLHLHPSLIPVSRFPALRAYHGGPCARAREQALHVAARGEREKDSALDVCRQRVHVLGRALAKRPPHMQRERIRKPVLRKSVR